MVKCKVTRLFHNFKREGWALTDWNLGLSAYWLGNLPLCQTGPRWSGLTYMYVCNKPDLYDLPSLCTIWTITPNRSRNITTSFTHHGILGNIIGMCFVQIKERCSTQVDRDINPKIHEDSLSETAVETRQRKCWMDNIKDWTSLPAHAGTAHDRPPAEKTGRGSLLNRPSGPPLPTPPHPPSTTQPFGGLNWSELKHVPPFSMVPVLVNLPAVTSTSGM